MKKIPHNIMRLMAVITVIFSISTTVYAISDKYTVLAPLPGTTSCGTGGGTNCTTDLKTYLPALFNWAIGIAAVMAFVMITAGGIEYMTSDSIYKTENGRKKIENAIWGLILVIGAYVILYTINPAILSFKLDIEAVNPVTNDSGITGAIGGESNLNPNPIAASALQARGINCPGNGGKSALESIGKQFIGETTYNQAKRNTYDSSTIYLDCSSFVSQVYRCAGLNSPGSITTNIFSSGATRVNGKTDDFEKSLSPGDLIGWKPGDNAPVTNAGHVMIYLGNGQILDQQTDRAGGVQVRSFSTWKKYITYIKK